MRFILLFVLFVVAGRAFFTTGAQIPYLQWIGHLPGDLVVNKNRAILIYFPLTTSLIVSLILSLIFGHWRRKNRIIAEWGRSRWRRLRLARLPALPPMRRL